MRMNKLSQSIALATITLVMGGVAVAQEEPEMTDREYCQLEAEDMGLVEKDEIQEYVAGCLNDIRLQAEAEAEAEVEAEVEVENENENESESENESENENDSHEM